MFRRLIYKFDLWRKTKSKAWTYQAFDPSNDYPVVRQILKVMGVLALPIGGYAVIMMVVNKDLVLNSCGSILLIVFTLIFMWNISIQIRNRNAKAKYLREARNDQTDNSIAWRITDSK